MRFITLPDGRRLNADLIISYVEDQSGQLRVLCVSNSSPFIIKDISLEEFEKLIADAAAACPEARLNDTLTAVGALLEKRDLPGALSSFARRLETAMERLVRTFPTSVRIRM